MTFIIRGRSDSPRVMYRKSNAKSGRESLPLPSGSVANLVRRIEGRETAPETTTTAPAKEKQQREATATGVHGTNAANDAVQRNKTSSDKPPPSPRSAASSSATQSSSPGTAAVEDAWTVIEDRRLEELKSRAREESALGDIERRTLSGWKTVRVFVSSTFADMHSEREILVKKVFSELREWCEERKFTLVECDLRWGVPKDSSSRTTICTCLEELDRCHEDNGGLPFFVSMLSDRYGWIPSTDEVPDDVKSKYNWVSNVSITHMEILHGAYWFDNPNAIFCLRNPSYIKELPPDKLGRFVDSEDLNRMQMKVLKEKLASRFHDQVFEYSCLVDGIDLSTGREKVNITGLEKFAEKILQFLKDHINIQYPDHHLSPELSEDEKEENAHMAAAQLKSEFFVGREKELQSLLTYLNEGRAISPLRSKTEEERDGENEEEKAEKQRRKSEELLEECRNFGVQVDDSKLVSIIGEPGIGKSSLLAKLAKTVKESNMNVLFHSVGATDKSTTKQGIMHRITRLIMNKTEAATEEEKKEGESENSEQKIEVEFINALTRAGAEGIQLVIIIDGIDEMADNESVQFLSWLPPRFPGNIRCIVSSDVKHYPCIARLESRDSYFLDLGLLSPEEATSMVYRYLLQFNKKLDEDQLSSLLGHKSACLPLWLSTACEELRVFGDFATISEKIRKFPEELNDLLKDVLKRLIREDETCTMQKILSWICCSSSGLYEKNILILLGNPETKEEAPLVTWSTVRRHLKPFIRSTGDSQSIRIQMAHRTMNQAVVDLLFSDKSYYIKCHSYLADFYERHCPTQWMTINELPHHLYNAELFTRMASYFRTDPRSIQSNNYFRSQYLCKLRCNNSTFAHGNASSCLVVICQWCAMKGKLLSPTPFPTKNLCAICGDFVPFKRPNYIAKVCSQHQASRLPGQTFCAICKTTIHNTMTAEPMYICNFCYCSSMNRCSYVQLCGHGRPEEGFRVCNCTP